MHGFLNVLYEKKYGVFQTGTHGFDMSYVICMHVVHACEIRIYVRCVICYGIWICICIGTLMHEIDVWTMYVSYENVCVYVKMIGSVCVNTVCEIRKCMYEQNDIDSESIWECVCIVSCIYMRIRISIWYGTYVLVECIAHEMFE